MYLIIARLNNRIAVYFCIQTTLCCSAWSV